MTSRSKVLVETGIESSDHGNESQADGIHTPSRQPTLKRRTSQTIDKRRPAKNRRQFKEFESHDCLEDWENSDTEPLSAKPTRENLISAQDNTSSLGHLDHGKSDTPDTWRQL